MNRLCFGMTRQPCLFHGERKNWCQPACQAIKQHVDDLQRSLAPRARRRIAIKRVLANIEIEGREFHRHQIRQLRKDALEVEFFITLPHDRIEFGKAVQHQAFKFGHLRPRRIIAAIMRQRSQHPADRVAQFAVTIDRSLEDFRPDAQVFRIIR